MKSRRLLVVLISIVSLGILWLALTDSEKVTEPVATGLEKPITENNQNEAPNINIHTELVSISNNSQAEKHVASTLNPKSDSQSETPGIQDQAPEADQGFQQTSELLEQTTQDLHLEEGLSPHNLMILQDLAIRLHDLQSTDNDALLQNSTAEWPSELRDTLRRLSTALQAETDLRKTWKEAASQNPDGYREAFLEQQKQILGPELFDKLYAEDDMVVDEAGLSAHYASKEDAQSLQSKTHQDKLKLIDQWRQDQLSEAELKDALADSLSPDEIEQLIDTGLNEAAWLDQLDHFLDEYRYIEQSGVIGEDEAQLRQELIEKHFPPENRLIVNQFLFGTQAAPK